MDGYEEFEKLYHHLKDSQLLSYESKVTEAKESAEIEFREQFLSKLQENIVQARTEFSRLNKSLETIPFGGDYYKFEYFGSRRYREYYDMIMDDFNVIEGISLLTGQFHERHRKVIDELFEKLTCDEDSAKVLDEFTDYRTYMDYDIRIDHGRGSYSYYSKVCEEKSGGETQTPFYVTEKSLPEYFDLTSDACEVIHREVQALVMAGLAEAVWKNGIEGHILEKVKLNLSAVDEAYAYLGRSAKNVQIEKLFAYMDSCTDGDGGRPLCAPVEKCFAYIRRRLGEGLSVKKYVDFNDLDRFADVMKGCGTALISDAAVDLAALPQGMGFAGNDLGRIAWAQDERVRQIITIENLTAFYRFSCPGAVIVYLGGFRILLDLRRKRGLDIMPLHMDVSVLEKYKAMCRPLTKEDKKGLGRMIEEPDGGRVPEAHERIIKDSVLWMLENNLKLEQEIVVYEMMKKQI